MQEIERDMQPCLVWCAVTSRCCGGLGVVVLLLLLLLLFSSVTTRGGWICCLPTTAVLELEMEHHPHSLFCYTPVLCTVEYYRQQGYNRDKTLHLISKSNWMDYFYKILRTHPPQNFITAILSYQHPPTTHPQLPSPPRPCFHRLHIASIKFKIICGLLRNKQICLEFVRLKWKSYTSMNVKMYKRHFSACLIFS